MQITSSFLFEGLLEATYNQTINFVMTHYSVVVAADQAAREDFSKTDRYQLLEAAQDFGLSAAELRLYLYFVRYSDSDRKLSKTIEAIAADLGMKSIAAVRRTIDGFRVKGILRRLTNDKKFTYCLTDPLDWVKSDTDPKRSDPKRSDPKRSDPKQPSSATPPLKGVLLEEVVVSAENTDPKRSDPKRSTDVQAEVKQKEADQTPLDEVIVATGSLGEKIEHLRSLSIHACAVKCEQEIYVQANNKTYSVEEFMALPPDAFHVVKSTEQDRASCWERIAANLKKASASVRADFARRRERLGLPPLRFA